MGFWKHMLMGTNGGCDDHYDRMSFVYFRSCNCSGNIGWRSIQFSAFHRVWINKLSTQIRAGKSSYLSLLWLLRSILIKFLKLFRDICICSYAPAFTSCGRLYSNCFSHCPCPPWEESWSSWRRRWTWFLDSHASVLLTEHFVSVAYLSRPHHVHIPWCPKFHNQG